jgi:hypothetical protein
MVTRQLQDRVVEAFTDLQKMGQRLAHPGHQRITECGALAHDVMGDAAHVATRRWPMRRILHDVEDKALQVRDVLVRSL